MARVTAKTVRTWVGRAASRAASRGARAARGAVGVRGAAGGRATSGVRGATLVLGTVAMVATTPAPTTAQEVDATGTGWVLSELDIDVHVHPEESRIRLEADLVVRLAEHPRSSALMLAMNSRDTIMAFDSVTTGRGTVAALNAAVPGRDATRAARIEIAEAALRGEEIRVRVYASSRKSSFQFSLAEDVMLASWVTGWYPVPIPSRGTSLSAALKAPGRTRFNLPSGWRVSFISVE